MLSLIANKGLGDALYLRALTLRYLEDGEDRINVFTFWPNAFFGLPDCVEIKNPVTMRPDEPGLKYLAYCITCPFPEGHSRAYSQFAMATRRLGFDDVDLKLGWTIQNVELVKMVHAKAAGRPIMLYQPLKQMDHPEARLLRPLDDDFERYLKRNSNYFRIRIGHPNYLSMKRKRRGDYDLDLIGCPISDVFDLAMISTRIFCEPCFLVVLAEATDTEFTCLFSRRAQRERFSIAYNVKPARIFYKPHLATVLYDEEAALVDA